MFRRDIHQQQGSSQGSGQSRRPDTRWMHGLQRSQSVDSLREQTSSQESESRQIASTSHDYGLAGIGADNPPRRQYQGPSLRDQTTQYFRDGGRIEPLSTEEVYPSLHGSDVQEREFRRITSTSHDYGLAGIGADNPPRRQYQGPSLRDQTTQYFRDGGRIEPLSTEEAYPDLREQRQREVRNMIGTADIVTSLLGKHNRSPDQD